MNVLDKSKADWQQMKGKDATLEEELEAHRCGLKHCVLQGMHVHCGSWLSLGLVLRQASFLLNFSRCIPLPLSTLL